MPRTSYQHGTKTEQKSTVLTWRLPKRQANVPAPAREIPKTTGPVFGRRTVPPAG